MSPYKVHDIQLNSSECAWTYMFRTWVTLKNIKKTSYLSEKREMQQNPSSHYGRECYLSPSICFLFLPYTWNFRRRNGFPERRLCFLTSLTARRDHVTRSWPAGCKGVSGSSVSQFSLPEMWAWWWGRYPVDGRAVRLGSHYFISEIFVLWLLCERKINSCLS